MPQKIEKTENFWPHFQISTKSRYVPSHRIISIPWSEISEQEKSILQVLTFTCHWVQQKYHTFRLLCTFKTGLIVAQRVKIAGGHCRPFYLVHHSGHNNNDFVLTLNEKTNFYKWTIPNNFLFIFILITVNIFIVKFYWGLDSIHKTLV